MAAGTVARLTVVVLLAAAEAAITLLALRPEVPERYRAFFIDRTTDCWPIAVSGHYEMGEKISLLPGGEAARPLLACGWAQPTVEGTWATGPEARLYFALGPESRQELQLELEIFGFVTVGHVVQRVEIEANGQPLTTLVLQNGSPGLQVIRIPAAVTSAGSGLDLIFRFPDAVSPKSQNLGKDERRLAARLVSLRLSAVPRVAALGRRPPSGV